MPKLEARLPGSTSTHCSHAAAKKVTLTTALRVRMCLPHPAFLANTEASWWTERSQQVPNPFSSFNYLGRARFLKELFPKCCRPQLPKEKVPGCPWAHPPSSVTPTPPAKLCQFSVLPGEGLPPPHCAGLPPQPEKFHRSPPTSKTAPLCLPDAPG